MPVVSINPFELPEDVVFYLLRMCSVVSLARFRSLDRLAATYVSRELERRFRNLLRRFVYAGDHFRAMLDAHDAVISGSGALAVCLHGGFSPHDLDVYVPKNALSTMVSYLINAESYHISSFRNPASAGVYQGGIATVICLRRGTRCIDLVASHTECATLPIPHFWSTATMLYITGHSFCVPYPTLLDDRRALLNPARLTIAGAVADLSPVIQKYRSFGFDFYLNEVDWRRKTSPTWECPRHISPSCPITVRWFGDCFCLEGDIGIGTRWRTAARLTTVWWRGGVPCGERCRTGEHGLVSGVWTQLRKHLE